MKVFSKTYRGPFYVVAMILSLALTVLSSDEIANLNWSWVDPIIQAIPVVLILVQQFTPVGEGGE